MLQINVLFSIHTSFFLFLLNADDLIKVHKFKPTIKWRQSFENYLKTMPPYYIGVSVFFPHLIAMQRPQETLHRSYCCVLSTVPEKGAQNHGSTKPAG